MRNKDGAIFGRLNANGLVEICQKDFATHVFAADCGEWKKIINENRCVACGATIPEGSMCCASCLNEARAFPSVEQGKKIPSATTSNKESEKR